MIWKKRQNGLSYCFIEFRLLYLVGYILLLDGSFRQQNNADKRCLTLSKLRYVKFDTTRNGLQNARSG